MIAGSLAFAGASYAQAVPAGGQGSTFTPQTRAAGEKNDTKALQRAIDAMHDAGGGTVHIVAGRYLIGSLFLRSYVSLWLDNGATLVMSDDPADFFPPEKLPYDPRADRDTSDFRRGLLIGDTVEHVAIYGEGVIDCNRKKSNGPKPIAMRRCSQIRIEGITIRNAPANNIGLLGCEYVTIDGVTIRNGFSDGIDPDCCRYVRIANCFIESVDDAICLKASGALGERRSTEYVTVDNCVLRTASIHFKCGTESCGDFQGIAVSNTVFQGGMGMRHGNPGIALYTTDGGKLEDVVISNIVMRDVGTPLAILRGNRDRCSVGAPGPLQSIRISNVIASGAKLPSVIAGLPNQPVTGIAIDGMSVSMGASAAGPRALDTIPEHPTDYPQPTMFGPLPAYGLFLRHVTGIRLRDVQLQPTPDEQRAAIVADDVAALRLLDYEDRCGNSPTRLWLKNVRDAIVEVTGTMPPPQNCYRIEGPNTANLIFQSKGSALDRNRVLDLDATVPPGTIHF
jgi:hypothetical protein